MNCKRPLESARPLQAFGILDAISGERRRQPSSHLETSPSQICQRSYLGFCMLENCFCPAQSPSCKVPLHPCSFPVPTHTDCSKAQSPDCCRQLSCCCPAGLPSDRAAVGSSCTHLAKKLHPCSPEASCLHCCSVRSSG